MGRITNFRIIFAIQPRKIWKKKSETYDKFSISATQSWKSCYLLNVMEQRWLVVFLISDIIVVGLFGKLFHMLIFIFYFVQHVLKASFKELLVLFDHCRERERVRSESRFSCLKFP